MMYYNAEDAAFLFKCFPTRSALGDDSANPGPGQAESRWVGLTKLEFCENGWTKVIFFSSTEFIPKRLQFLSKFISASIVVSVMEENENKK